MRLLRSKPSELDAYFGEIGVSTAIASTQATVHCRYLKLDGSHSPRVKDLADRLARELINYAIPRSEIEAAATSASGPHDAKFHAALYRKATRLFTDLAKTGEGGEILLYLMAETYLRLPQILCKMSLKTSSQMHYHGVDGVHGAVDPVTGTLTLYWGESKLYATPSGAIDACFTSLAPFVLPTGGSATPLKRDIELITDNIDLGDPATEAALLRYLNPDDPLFNKLTYRGIALVGFDSDSYTPATTPLVEGTLLNILQTSVASWHNSCGFHINKHKVAEIGIELFCVPFPSVEAFRDAFLTEIGAK